MRIVIDARTGDGTGVSRYSLNLIRQLEKLPTKHEFIVLLGTHDFNAWEPTKPNFTRKLVPFKFYSFGEQSGLLKLLNELKPDLVHFTAFNSPLLYRGKKVVTIHDLTLVRFKNVRGGLVHKFLYEGKYWAMRLILRHAVLSANKVVTPTKFVKNDLISKWGHARFWRLSRKNVAVTLEAADAIAAKQQKPLVDGEYLVYAGACYPHKNVGMLLTAFEEIQRVKPGLKLVIIGKQDYWQQQLRAAAVNNAGVIFTGYVSNDELASYYQHATLFVFPSLSEGFGLPPLEAMAYGTPVLSSNLSAMPETCGDAAEYFNPNSRQDLVEKLMLLLNNPKRREELSKLGKERVGEFSWKRMAEQTLAVYDEVLKVKAE